MADIPTIEDFKRLLDAHTDKIVSEFEARLKSSSIPSNTKWLRSRDVKEMMNVSDGTLANLRAGGHLKSKKIRGMHFYLQTDVLKMLERNEK